MYALFAIGSGLLLTSPPTQVYLEQLQYAFTTRSVASYFGSSPSSSKQAPSPSPTFSPTQPQAQLPNPPSPVNSTPATRRSVGPGDTEKDLPFARPIFTEEEIKLLSRNCGEILIFHEHFVDDLKEALTPLGPKFRFDDEDEYAYVDMPRHDTLELAIQIIVSMFVDRVSRRFVITRSHHFRHLCRFFLSCGDVTRSANTTSG